MTGYSLDDFDYALPPERIAQYPLPERSASRLLVVDRAKGTLEDRCFADLAGYLGAGDALVMNSSRVFPARLDGHKPTGGRVEVLLLDPWLVGTGRRRRCLVRPFLKEGQEVLFPGGVKARRVGSDPDGSAILEFDTPDVLAFAKKKGKPPLPPYIKRETVDADAERYQTVYAKDEGSVAAPTAGLHFTAPLVEKIREKGVRICEVVLHVGFGTFQPVRDFESHRMHRERFVLSQETADVLNRVRAEGKKIWAVGTTATRVLETCVLKGNILAGEGDTDLFIVPGTPFEAVGGLVTNFHLPKSTLMILVCAFAGVDLIKKAYAHAIRENYRFYSYGDAMLIL